MTIQPIHKSLGVSDARHEELYLLVVETFLEQLRAPASDVDPRAATIKALLEKLVSQNSVETALIGLMVEQAYNAAVQSQGFKFPKKKK